MFKKGFILLLSVALVMSLTACAGDSQEEIELAQGVTDDEILIGTLIAQSGPVAPIGIPVLRGMEAYFKMINDQGGINGRKIRLIAEDDEFNAQKSILLAEKLVYEDEVFAIVGQLGTAMVLATMEIFQESGIPAVYQGGGSGKFTTAGANYFPVQPVYPYEGKLFSKFAVEELKAEKVVFVYQNDDTGKEALAGFKEGLKHYGKEEILLEEIAITPGEVDFTTHVQLSQTQDPDLVIVHALLGGATGYLKAAHEVGFKTQFLTQYANSDQTLMLLAGDAAEGVMVTGWVDITRNEQYTDLVDAMAKYYPDQFVNSYAVAGWIAAEVFVEGLRLAGDNLSWEGFIAAMETMDFTDGLASRVAYSPGYRNGVEEMVFMQVVRDASGQLVFEMITDFISVDWK
jgi:branched-chain amino acid transport system substrate-binding protein